jgi:hypothetical protein
MYVRKEKLKTQDKECRSVVLTNIPDYKWDKFYIIRPILKAVSPRTKNKIFESINKIFSWCVSSIFARGAEFEHSIFSPSRNSKTYYVQKGRTTFQVKVNINLMKMAPPFAYTKQLPNALAHILGFNIMTLRASF